MLEFTEEETEALKKMIEEWIHEGFTSPPYKPAIASIIRKLGLWMRDAVAARARECSYHPVREYLQHLKWDGTKRWWSCRSPPMSFDLSTDATQRDATRFMEPTVVPPLSVFHGPCLVSTTTCGSTQHRLDITGRNRRVPYGKAA